MKTQRIAVIAGIAGLMSMAVTTAECREIGAYRGAESSRRIAMAARADIVRRFSGQTGQSLGQGAENTAGRATAQKQPERALDLCLSRCAGPVEEVATQRAGITGGMDLHDAAMAARIRKVGMGLNWKAARNLGISADYEKAMDSAETNQLATDVVRARMQWNF